MNNTELIMKYYTQSGESEAVFFSDINLNSTNCSNNVCYFNFNPGYVKLKVESKGGYVLLNKTS